MSARIKCQFGAGNEGLLSSDAHVSKVCQNKPQMPRDPGCWPGGQEAVTASADSSKSSAYSQATEPLTKMRAQSDLCYGESQILSPTPHGWS